jgi:hypothetical protein
MVLYHQKLPQCISHDSSIKTIKSKSDFYPFFITTNENYISGHCQFNQFNLYETYGLFLSGLNFDNSNPEIDHNKVFDLISNTDKITNIFTLQKIYSNKPYIKKVTLYDSYRISHQFIKKKENYKENRHLIDLKWRKLLLDEIKGYHHPIYGIPVTPSICHFCNQPKINENLHINLHTDGHTWSDANRWI